MITDAELRAARSVIRAANKQRAAARPKVKRERRVEHVNVKADRGRVRDTGYLAYLRRQPCSVGNQWGAYCEGRIDPAHIRTHKPGELPTGLSRKPDDRRCTSLCRHHHDEQHGMNEMAFWRRYGLDPFEVAERLFAAYQAEGTSNG